MAVLFAVGVMNMLWVLLLTVFVLLEKTGPVPQKYIGITTGLSLLIWGTYYLSLYPW